MLARIFALIVLLAPFTAQAISPVDASRLPFRINKDGNQYIYTSVDGKNFTKSTLFTSAGVQHNAPILTAEGPMPYANKSGAKVTLNKAIDKAKAAAAAASGLSAAAAAKLKPGNPYVMLAEVSCLFLCAFAIEAMYDWGASQLKSNGDGTFSVAVPDPSVKTDISDGYLWSTQKGGGYLSASAACQGYQSDGALVSAGYPGGCVFRNISNSVTFGLPLSRYAKSSCPAGSSVVAGVCNGVAPTVDTRLGDYMQSNYMGRGWNHHLANMTAAIIANGGNVFTDGTSGDITGPAIVPLVSTETKTAVNLSPGTTTEVALGHVGSTDSGTKTTTTTTTAKNSYTSGSASTGGPTVSATQQTQTTTNITNNVTNITNTTTTTETKTDDAPKEEEKDFCEKNPDSLACAELDTPEEEIPRRTLEITFEPEDLGLGRGSCPADRQMVDYTFSYQPTCDTLATYVYPLTILLASFGALIIIFVGRTDA